MTCWAQRQEREAETRAAIRRLTLDGLVAEARRAALRHWVREHWRKARPVDGAHRAWVREHLRGAQQFVWNGLRCSIIPSDEDRERASLSRGAA